MDSAKAIARKDALFAGVFSEGAVIAAPTKINVPENCDFQVGSSRVMLLEGGVCLIKGEAFVVEVPDAPGGHSYVAPPVSDGGIETDDHGFGYQNLFGGSDNYPSSPVRADMIYIPIRREKVCPVSLLCAREPAGSILPQAGFLLSGEMHGSETKLLDRPYHMTPGKVFTPYSNDVWIDWLFSTPNSDARVIIFSLNVHSS